MGVPNSGSGLTGAEDQPHPFRRPRELGGDHPKLRPYRRPMMSSQPLVGHGSLGQVVYAANPRENLATEAETLREPAATSPSQVARELRPQSSPGIGLRITNE